MTYNYTPGFTSSTYYPYDDNGNILSVSDGTHTTLYVYDSACQLLRENNQAAGKTWVWTYDNAGNILSKTEYAYTTGALGAALDTVVYTYGDAEWGDLLTAYDGVSITYDAMGNPLHDGTWTYVWEHGRQLAQMKRSGATWYFTYDADGMRTQRRASGAAYTYVYNGGQLSRMTYNGAQMHFTYDASGNPLSVTFNGSTYYYVVNLQGDVVAILNSTDTQVVGYTYDAWGRLLTTTGTMANTLGYLNPLRYRGYVYDQETELYYLQTRYYDPALGRFLNADAYTSTGQGILGNNMFAYCLNNPISMEDVSGAVSRVCIGAESVVDEEPWRDHSPSGGGYTDRYHSARFDNTKASQTYWEGSWFETDPPIFLLFNEDGFVLFSWDLSVYKAVLYLDENREQSVYVSVGSISVYAGIHLEHGIGFSAAASAFSIGYDGEIVGLNVDFITAELTRMYKNKKWFSGTGFAVVGLGYSVDIAGILEYFWGG